MKLPWQRRPRRADEPPCIGCGQRSEPEQVVAADVPLPEPDAVVHRVTDVLCAVVESGLLVMHPATGRYQLLSTSAALVYTSIDGVATLAAIVDDLVDLTGGDRETLDEDVRSAVAAMLHEQIVTLEPTRAQVAAAAPGVVGAPGGRDITRAERWGAARLRRLRSREWPHRLGPFWAGGVAVEVFAAAPDVLPRAAPHTSLLPAANEPSAGSATAPQKAFIHVDDNGRRQQVFLNGMRVDRPSNDAQLTAEIVLSACNQAAALGPAGSIRIHGAAVERDGRAVIVCGPSGYGKSSLCTALLGAGWSYLTDEVAIIDPSTLRVVPYPKWIDLSTEALERVGHAPTAPQPDTGYEQHVPPLDVGAVSPGATLAAIVVLERHVAPGQEASAEVLQPTAAVLAMLGNVFDSTWDDPQTLQGLADVCQQVRVATLHRGPFVSMVEAVSKLAETESTSATADSI